MSIFKKTVSLCRNIDGRKVRAEIRVEIVRKSPCSPFTSINHEVLAPAQTIDVLSISGSLVGGGNNTCGQCLDEILEVFPDDDRIKVIHKTWKQYHLNDMRAGCVHQIEGNCSDQQIMAQVCSKTGYKYGSAWLFEEIPTQVLNELRRALDSFGNENVPTLVEDFSSKHGISIQTKFLSRTKAGSEYEVTLRSGDNAMVIPSFHMGSALKHKPDLSSVLECLASDAQIAKEDFDEFADELGMDYSKDSHRMHQNVLAQTKRLEKFLGKKAFAELLELEF
jgi:hypothetical protein